MSHDLLEDVRRYTGICCPRAERVTKGMEMHVLWKSRASHAFLEFLPHVVTIVRETFAGAEYPFTISG